MKWEATSYAAPGNPCVQIRRDGEIVNEVGFSDTAKGSIECDAFADGFILAVKMLQGQNEKQSSGAR